MTKHAHYRVAVDIGGTFTDSVIEDGRGRILATTKTPTTPQNPTLGALEGVDHVLAQAGVEWDQIGGFIHGTTLATNALIERRGARVCGITTAGFRDILEIGYERRYSQYDMNIQKPDLLVPRSRCFTIGGRMDAQGREVEPLERAAVARLVDDIAESRAEAAAICLLHAYANPAHEQELRALLQAALPGLVISISSDVSPEAREFDRLCTTIANAYIQPLMSRYLYDFVEEFEGRGLTCPILMMCASGGMTTIGTAARLPIRLVESGPAGGAILAARIARSVGEEQVISFDMGGTTAKLCLIDHYQPQTGRKFEIARAARFIKGSGMPVRIPVLEMIEIGAGGGSIAHVDGLGRIGVGPQSMGSDPGPAAFSRGGEEPTVTDADILHGLIDPGAFAEGRITIDKEAAARAMLAGVGSKLGLSAEQAAAGVSEIVDESMASAGRMHAVESGKDLSARCMIAFGGNGPLHVTRMARRAGVSRILIPRDPGVGSAIGFLSAPVSYEIVRSRYATLEGIDIAALNDFYAQMIDEAQEVVRAGAPKGDLSIKKQAFMRYHGQGHEIEIPLPEDPLEPGDIATIRADFEREYGRQFSRAVPGMRIEILNWALSISSSDLKVLPVLPVKDQARMTPTETRKIMCEVTGEACEAGLFMREALNPGDIIPGPALLREPQTTTYVSRDFTARIDAGGNIVMQRNP